MRSKVHASAVPSTGQVFCSWKGFAGVVFGVFGTLLGPERTHAASERSGARVLSWLPRHHGGHTASSVLRVFGAGSAGAATYVVVCRVVV
jgi:hypothetical protein